MINVTDEQILRACANYVTMTDACRSLKIDHRVFKRLATKLGVYKPNKGAKGKTKDKSFGKGFFKLDDILLGKHPTYGTNKLRIRLIKEGVKEHRCECCKSTEWNGLKIPLELNHIDGNNKNHKISNLELLCPNCHAQTSTYRGKNTKTYKGKNIRQ